MSEITVEQLEKKFPGQGFIRFTMIADLGGFGSVNTFNYGIDPSCALDLRGCLDEANDAVSAEDKAAIKRLVEDEDALDDDAPDTEPEAEKKNEEDGVADDDNGTTE